ncbi:YoaK family protein [Anaerolinea sp.]|uniref:YoaK family protein n=1 Tax=Anaerolinea sp. TaxID=1872519 RepID=UPI002ACE47DB|nr:YoaK family protein [Anaerolinea sp.]
MTTLVMEDNSSIFVIKSFRKLIVPKETQASESLYLGTILAISGGFMDAYTYICRGQVFANAQTGNIVLLGVNLSEGRWLMALRYLPPVLAFISGILISDWVRYQYKRISCSIHWRQIVILIEALTFMVVGFFPQSLNLLANSLVSLACGIQVESFRKIHGNSVATTMCIGNLRAAVEAFTEFLYFRTPGAGKRTGFYGGMIVAFAVGSVLGNYFVRFWRERAIFVSCFLMIIGFLLMFVWKSEHVQST